MAETQGTSLFASVQRPRSLPVLVLADVSGSMGQDGKIQALNDSVSKMIRAFATEQSPHGEITVGVITFGNGRAQVHQPVTPAAELSWTELAPAGNTPMGQAFELARTLLDHEETVPRESYQPVLVLVSDGMPNDEWETPLEALCESQRGAKALRLAVAVGADVGSKAHRVLEKFVTPGYRVYPADEAEGLRHFLQWVTFSVTASVRSGRPGDPGAFDPAELYDLTD
jgi:uncharacterized protein YegL